MTKDRSDFNNWLNVEFSFEAIAHDYNTPNSIENEQVDSGVIENDQSLKMNIEPSVFEKKSRQYTTGNSYNHKQDLVAVFWNCYIYYEEKFERYFKEYNKIPHEIFNDLVFGFRQNFPKDQSRIPGVNYFDDLIELLVEKYQDNKVEVPKDFTEKIWFKVGILFATGKMDELVQKHDYNVNQIAKDLSSEKWTSWKTYISQSLANTKKTDKNIFSSRDKMLKIIEYCKIQKTPVNEGFISKLPPE